MTERDTLTAPDGTTIAYADHGGDGPATLLVHGITERDESWRPVIDRLVADRHVYSMDLRGHGSSGLAQTYDLEAMAGDVVAVMDALGVLGSCHVSYSNNQCDDQDSTSTTKVDDCLRC